ncbi:MAG: hypothetical protein L6R35_004119 [Caloplaca aegaea]|nr:MAG: hypothetical protein L6R35_004119 [Caloplaca aegaea]
MQSQWIPLFTSTLSLESYRSATYVPAGSCCKLVSEIKRSEDEVDCYEIIAGLANMDDKIYLSSRFLLPSLTPDYPLSRYLTSWDDFDREYKVSLRQPIPRVMFPMFPVHTVTQVTDGAYSPYDSNSSKDDNPTSPATSEPGTPISINQAPLFPPDDEIDLPESPIKPHLLERPGAPTPGRGRTRYDIDGDSDDGEDFSYTMAEDLSEDDVFGDGEASHTWEDPYALLPHGRAGSRLSMASVEKDAPRASFDLDEMATLSAPDSQESVMVIEESSSAQQSLDIDLDEVFGEDTADFEEDGEDIVMSHASDLLARRTQGLLLSRFIPTGRNACEALRAAFQFKDWNYNLRHAKVAAAEVAYHFFSEGLYDLKDNGFAIRQYPMESEHSIEWKSRQRDVAALIPYDPRSCKAEMLRYAMRKPQRVIVSHVDPHSRHYNFLGEIINLRSKTPATVSFFVQLSATVKPYRNEFSRIGVVLSQANKYIDAVIYDGPPELLSHRGTALQEQTTGYVSKLNDYEGSFGDDFDGGTTIKGFHDICNHFLANNWHINLQRPCIMDYEEQAHRGDRDLLLNEPAPREFFRKRNGQGVIEHWCLPGAIKPQSRASKLREVQSVDDDDHDGPLSPRGPVDFSDEQCEDSSLVGEEAGKDTVSPSQIAQVNDSGYISEKHESSNTEARPEAKDTSVEEYDPLNPGIPGLYRILYDDDYNKAEEVSDGEIRPCVTDLLETTGCHNVGNDIQQSSGDSSSEQDSDEDKHLDRPITPPSPFSPVTDHFPPSFDEVYSSALSYSKISPCVLDTPEPKGLGSVGEETSKAVDVARHDTPSCLSSGAIEPEPEEAALESDPAVTTTTTPPFHIAPTEEEKEGLSRYAFGYGTLMFGIGIVLSMW